MRIAIAGYGKMGHILRSQALNAGHDISSVIDPLVKDPEVTSHTCDVRSLSGSDVVIEFSAANGILDRLAVYSEAGLPAVIATTGWYERMDEARELVEKKESAVIWSGNFALGVHLYFSIVRSAARLMDRFGSYDPLIQEVFHSGKGDSPSGTALMLGNILLEELGAKNRLETGRLDRKRADSEIHVSSVRGGSHPGTHTIMFDSPADTIEIIHRARNRDGFALGALQAAAWISGGRKGFFRLEDMLGDK
jgi:4-hydroxy-tetrahydrodipicolinate reductase